MKMFLEKIKKFFHRPHYIIVERTKGDSVTYVVQFQSILWFYIDLDLYDNLEGAKNLLERMCEYRRESKIKVVNKFIMGSDC